MRDDQNPPATRALSPARRAYGSRICAFLSFSDPAFHAGGAVPFLAQKRDTIHSALLGFSFGMGMFSAGVTWIYVSLHDFGAMPAPVAVLALIFLCAYLASVPCGYRLGAERTACRFANSLGVGCGALWGLSDWLRSVLFTGFPWLTLGYSQAPQSPLAGFAPVVGAMASR